MANRWETVETVPEVICLWSKITADDDCRHEIKRYFLLGRKVITNIDSTLKRKGITLPTKVHLVKAMVFAVVMYGCESWTVKKAEHHISCTYLYLYLYIYISISIYIYARTHTHTYGLP